VLWYQVDPNGYSLVRAVHTEDAWRAAGLLVSKNDFETSGLDPFALFYADLLPDPDNAVTRPIVLSQSELCLRAAQGIKDWMARTGQGVTTTSLLEPMLLGGDEVEVHRSDQGSMLASLAMEWPHLEPDQRKRIGIAVTPTRMSLPGVPAPRVMAISDRQVVPELSSRADATGDHVVVEPKSSSGSVARGFSDGGRVPSMTLQASAAIRASLAQMRAPQPSESLLSAEDRAASEAIRASLSSMPARDKGTGEFTSRIAVPAAVVPPRAVDPEASAMSDDVEPEEQAEPETLIRSQYSTGERRRLVDLHIGAISDIGKGSSSPSNPSHHIQPADLGSRDDRVLEAWGLLATHGPVVVLSSVGSVDALAHVGKVMAASKTLAAGQADVNPVGFTLLGPSKSAEYVRDVTRSFEFGSNPPRPLVSDEYSGAGVALRCRAVRNLWARVGGGRGIGSGSEALVVVPTAPLARWPALLEEVRSVGFFVDATRLITDVGAIREDLSEQLDQWEDLIGPVRVARLKISIVLTNLDHVTDSAQLSMWGAIVGSLKRIADARMAYLEGGVLNDMAHLGALTAKGVGADRLADIFQDRGIKVEYFVLPSVADSSLESLGVQELPILSMLHGSNLRLILDRRPRA
jgi:hypothetical protein